jgi:hypothetical protein
LVKENGAQLGLFDLGAVGIQQSSRLCSQMNRRCHCFPAQ